MRSVANAAGRVRPGPVLPVHFGFFTGRLHPLTVTWRLRSTVSSPGGAGFEIVDPAPMVAPD